MTLLPDLEKEGRSAIRSDMDSGFAIAHVRLQLARFSMLLGDSDSMTLANLVRARWLI